MPGLCNYLDTDFGPKFHYKMHFPVLRTVCDMGRVNACQGEPLMFCRL
jgi:hypothetical protein